MAGVAGFAAWLSFVGTFTALLGLGWDARMHRLHPDLAVREGVFTVTNPAHALFLVGMALVVVGTFVLIVGQTLRSPGASWLRRTAAVLAIALLAGLSVVTFAAAVSGQGSPGHDHGSAAGAATPEQKAMAARLLEDVKAGIARFADLNIAQADGYRQTTPYRFGQWGPAHFNNFAYNRDSRLLDPTRPEALVYIKLQDGRVVLIGAMFLAGKGQGPRPAGPITEWHVHDNLCLTSTGTVALATGPGQCPPGSFFVGEAVEMMHVWIFDHPGGAFAHELTDAAIRAAYQYAMRNR